MDSKRWEQIQNIFHEALSLNEPDRQKFLQTACGDDKELLSEVIELLEMDNAGHSVLDKKREFLASQILDGSVPNIEAIGSYQIMGVLGKGGMGVVYLGKHQNLNRLAAIKVLRDASLSPARRDRFEHEKQVLAQLVHPSIARLYEANVLPDGTPYFVMEYIEGVPVTTWAKKQALTIHERLHMFRAVCEAVQYAHQQTIIHRDLKPSNIFVKNDGTISLLDFGIAKQIDDLDNPGFQTQTGLRMMTPAYAAPEQLRNHRIGVFTDVYGLGVLLYELLTDELPFDMSGLTPGQAEALIDKQQPDKPSVKARQQNHLSGSAWDDLNVLCLTAMHKDPLRRYATVESLIRDLDHYLQGKPLEARPDSLSYRTGKFLKRNYQWISVAAVVLLVLIGMIAFYTSRLASSRDAALTEMEKTQRIQQFVFDLFQGGDEAAGPSDSLRVVPLLEEGVREAKALESEPEMQATMYLTLGEVFHKLGDLDYADSLLQASLEQRSRILGSDHPDVAESMLALGALRIDQAELDQADSLLSESVNMAKKHLPISHPVTLGAITALAKVRQEKGDYDASISILQEAVENQPSKKKSAREWALALGVLADSYFYNGEYDTSDSLYHILLEMDREHYGNRHPFVADNLINIGAIRFQQGYFEDAERYYREALDITIGFYGENHHETASDLSMLGRTLVHQERYEEARTLLDRSLSVREKVYGSTHPRVAAVLNELAAIDYQLGDTDAAIAHYSRMVDIYDEIYDGAHYLKGIARSNLAGVYYGEGNYEQAESLMREAVRFFTDTLPPDHLEIGIGRIRLGIFLEPLKRYEEAETELLAGYKILSDQTNPSTSWHRLARSHLADVYHALGKPEMAAPFEDEQTDTTRTP